MTHCQLLLKMVFQKLFKTRKKIVFFIITMSLCLIYSINWFIEYENNYWSPAPGQFNYFTETNQYSKLSDGYIVNTSTCQILNIDPWDKSIRHLFKEGKPIDCYGKYRHWTYVKGTSIIINNTALIESGFSVDSISCCYKTIQRVQQSPENYNMLADRDVSFSLTCSAMSVETQVKSSEEFVKVVCTSKYWPFQSAVVYRQFHTLALPYQSSRVFKKINWWKKNIRSEEKPPPNVIIIGIDSMSRLNFHRSFPKTKETLERIGAVEMLGYTKVGDNTLPNAIPYLTGYSLEELEKICFFTSQTKFDLCPFIWKHFSDAHYLTAHNEDAPFLTSFNFLKAGFVEQPTDFYLRPFMLGVSQHIDNVRYTFDCIGYNTIYDTVMDYNFQLLNLSNTMNTPLFLSSWITGLAHQDINSAKFGDSTFVNFFERLEQQNSFENTLLFFISDHGYRYGTLRQTFPGWYEDKLPFFWIYASESLKKRLPDVDIILRRNSRRLISPYDLYNTMAHILKIFNKHSLIEQDSKDRNGENIHRSIGQSLFHEIPLERKCIDAGIPSVYCACVMPMKLDVQDKFIVKSANTIVNYLNKILPEQCEHLSVSLITAGGVINKDSSTNKAMYVVTFVTLPGKFLFEANVDYSLVRNKETYNVSGTVLRLSKIDRDVQCVKSHIFELYCYCK